MYALRALRALVAVTTVLVGGVIAPLDRTGLRPAGGAQAASTGAARIQHIVYIVKENHTFDNYFGTFPGADGSTTGRLSNGKLVPLSHTPDPLLADIEHTPQAAQTAYDGGKMDGFN